jgi:electron transport complex protein RnfC
MSFTNDADRAEILEKEKVNICMECGCCSYVCPAKRPLVENNKLAKVALRDFNAKKKNG